MNIVSKWSRRHIIAAICVAGLMVWNTAPVAAQGGGYGADSFRADRRHLSHLAHQPGVEA